MNTSEQDVLQQLNSLVAENRRLRESLQYLQKELNLPFNQVAEDANALIFIYQDRHFIYVNPKVAESLGYERKELLDRPYKDFVHPKGHEVLEFLAKGCPDSSYLSRVHELILIGADGKNRHYCFTASLLNYDNHKAVVIHALDAIGPQKAEQALKESEAKYRTLTESAPDIIYTLDLEGRFSYVNPQWEAILGHKPEEVLGKMFVDFAPPRYEGEYIPHFKNIRNRKQAVHMLQGKLVHKNGEEKQFLLNAAPYLNEKGEVMGLVGTARDVTDRKRIEDQLRQAQKMEAVGTLAGGVAHDFNNILQSIQSYTQLLLLGKKLNDQDYRRLKQIEKSTHRASKLTQQLLAFSRKMETRFSTVDLNQVLQNIKALMQRSIPKMIKIEFVTTEDIRSVRADPSHIEQMIVNLAINAGEAMPEGGRLIIETANATLDQEYCRNNPGAKPGEYAMIAVSDTGHGMDVETVDHIFEPFFTTKEVGRGTGLGLSMVYGIVKNHDGYIECKSESGVGTTFRVYFPVVEEEAQMVTMEKASTDAMFPQGQGTILLVDDEEMLREVGQEFLESCGYRVFTASDGEMALDIYKKHSYKMDLVILDLVMPGMGGKQCLKEIMQINPSQKVIIASGFSGEGQAQEALEEGAKAFISKPYELTSLTKVLDKVLSLPDTQN